MLLIRVTVCGLPGVLPQVGRVANPRFRVTEVCSSSAGGEVPSILTDAMQR